MAASRLGRRTKIIAGVVAVLACLAALASYLYLRYVDVARFSAEHGRITVDAAPAGKLGTVLVTNKGFALYLFAPDAARHVTCAGGCASCSAPRRTRAAGGSSPTMAGRCTPTWAMPLPVTRPARAPMTTAATGT